MLLLDGLLTKSAIDISSIHSPGISCSTQSWYNTSALFKIGYGLYVLTVREGEKDNGCIVNSVMQVTSEPLQIAVCVNKNNYKHIYCL